jgi:hypothetical protein
MSTSIEFQLTDVNFSVNPNLIPILIYVVNKR